MTDEQQLFRRDLLLGHKSNKSRGQNLKIVLSKNHSQDTWKPGQQQHQNKYWPKFQGYQGKTLSFKSSNTKQNFLELTSVLQCKRSGSSLLPTNPISEVTLAERIKLFYLNLAKITQDPNILNII